MKAAFPLVVEIKMCVTVVNIYKSEIKFTLIVCIAYYYFYFIFHAA